jgi:3-hydroxyisobutyrate dehydrogenase-like beta-hydroxyacid dehydrogenase
MKVAVAGLGRMGEPIAGRLLLAGHDLTVWNRTSARATGLAAQGAHVAGTPAEVWDTASVCVTMLTDDAALAAVTGGADGLLAADGAGRTLVDMSTVSPASSAEVAGAAERSGFAYLRAPVSGNPSIVEAGNLTILVSGPKAAFDATEPLLRDIGPNVFLVGGQEEARVLKLALNLMLAGTAELIAEALVLGEANGLDRATMLEVMGASAVGSPFVKYKTAGLLADSYVTTFPTTGMVKDLTLALEVGRAAGAPLPAAELVERLLQACIDDGMGELDFMALFPRLRAEAGLAGS